MWILACDFKFRSVPASQTHVGKISFSFFPAHPVQSDIIFCSIIWLSFKFSIFPSCINMYLFSIPRIHVYSAINQSQPSLTDRFPLLSSLQTCVTNKNFYIYFSRCINHLSSIVKISCSLSASHGVVPHGQEWERWWDDESSDVRWVCSSLISTKETVACCITWLRGKRHKTVKGERRKVMKSLKLWLWDDLSTTPFFYLTLIMHLLPSAQDGEGNCGGILERHVVLEGHEEVILMWLVWRDVRILKARVVNWLWRWVSEWGALWVIYSTWSALIR